MFGIADYPAFVLAVIVFLAIPGPGNLALLTSTAKGGLRGGLAATLGVIAGDQVLMWAAVAGSCQAFQPIFTSLNCCVGSGFPRATWATYCRMWRTSGIQPPRPRPSVSCCREAGGAHRAVAAGGLAGGL